MKKLRDLIEYKYQKVDVFGTNYNYYIEWIYDQYCKGRNIKTELNKWEDNAKAVILGDIYKKNYQFLSADFGEEYISSKIAEFVLMSYKVTSFEHIANHSIYCDESMNLRKVKLTSESKEMLKNTFFVLGGVIVPDCVDLNDILQLFPEHSSGEFKYKFFSNKSKIPDCLSSNRISRLFDFLLDNDIKIHFNAKNYLYYALTDIIDSIMECEDFSVALKMKSVLYHFLMKSYDDTFDMLLEYDYPSIPKGKEVDFINRLSSIYKDSFYKHCKIGDQKYDAGFFLLKYLEEQLFTELPFIQDNEPSVLEDTLMYEYLHTATIFINNGVIFDVEQKIQEELDDVETDYLDQMNCSFVDSKTSIAIQISDFISGFIARLLKYFTSLSENEISDFYDMVLANEQMKNNLKKFLNLYQKSSDYYLYSICVKMSEYEKRLFDGFLDNISRLA